MKTQVGIVGAGPAGLTLSLLLAQQDVSSVVLESRPREYVETRVRAGLLEQNTVDLLRGLGVADRLDREGLILEGIYLRPRWALRDRGGLYAIPALVGASIVVTAYKAGDRALLFPILGALVCFAIRIAGVRYGLGLPRAADVAVTNAPTLGNADKAAADEAQPAQRRAKSVNVRRSDRNVCTRPGGLVRWPTTPSFGVQAGKPPRAGLSGSIQATRDPLTNTLAAKL